MNKKQQADLWITEHKGNINERFRLRYHLMGEVGWVNDPNGFSYYNDYYHLFYQFNPYHSRWGPMHWGHAISLDLVKWIHQEVALAPDSNWDQNGCFSGSAIVHKNQLDILYTGHIVANPIEESLQVQNLAISEDGIHFEKYLNNPVIGANQIPEFATKKDFRDPKIIHMDDRYYMLVASMSTDGVGQILCYEGPDLTNWGFLNVFLKGCKELGKMWECPDLFKLGDTDILMLSPQYMPRQDARFNNLHSAIYILGNSDLKSGVFERTHYYEIDCGFDFYAPQTVTTVDGGIILIAWMDMWEDPKPTDDLHHGWAGAMTLPRLLSLKNNKIYANPVDSIIDYRRNKIEYRNIHMNGAITIPGFCGSCYELFLELDLTDTKDLIFSSYLRVDQQEYTLLTYTQCTNTLSLDRNHSGVGLSGKREIIFANSLESLKLRIFVDISSIEVFINDGEYTMTSRIFPSELSQGIEFYTNQDYVVNEIAKWDIIL
ncbi:MAG: sucrose-6-phosphate hydrolase [Firmicutes bacterium HGW-Firmicutes-1]|jgi:beta-fructofuranosidase|nr:MAG: sucrose-6-phosphate hydrolase [Firmicutes bacterium HGW-Firmicutes-1]